MTKSGGVDYALKTKIEQEIFIDTDEDDIFAVKYTITITNTTADADAEAVTVKAVLGENLSWYERDDDTDALYFIEDISDLTDVPEKYDLDELAEYVENHTNAAKSAEEVLEPYASAVVWADQTIAGGEEETYVFYAAIAEGITTTDELPALYFVDGEQVTNTAEDQTIIKWKNEELLAENETEAETETESETEAESETETEAETETDTKGATVSETEVDSEKETGTETESETETEAETDTETESETETEIETETEKETETETETEIKTETEEEAYNFIAYEVSEGGEICLTYTDGYTETISPYMMSDDYDVEVNMPVTEPVEVSVTAYDGYAYVCAVVLDEEGNTIAAYDADTTAFTVTANADYKTTVQVTFAEDGEAYYFSEEMLAVASYEQLAAAAAEDDPDTLQGQINALLSSDTDSGISTAGEGGIATASLGDEITENSTTITLNQDYTEDLMILDGVKVTIDLNGHTITSAGTGKNAITVFGTLTLTDTSTAGSGKVTNNGYSNARGVDVAQGGSFTLEGGTITGFSAGGNGGGVLVENGGTFAMTGGTISDNTASGYGGGVFLYDANLIASMTGGTISGNTSSLSGGGLAANTASSSALTLQSGLTISGNKSGGYGGGVYFNTVLETLTISSTISGNTSTSEGGGVYFGATVTTLNIVDAIIDGNTSGAAGGGAYFAVAVPTAAISGSSISGNSAAGYGGGIWLTSGTSLTLENSETNTTKINNNKISAAGAMYGGGIYLNSANSYRSTFTSTGGEISGNKLTSTDSTNSYGSGIYIGSYAKVSMENTTVSGNSGATYGGGIAVNTYVQSITLTDLTVSENKAVASATANTGYGGGIWIGASSVGDVVVSGGKYSGNTSDYYGGAFYVTTAASSLVLKDAAKIDGNTAYNAGGGIYTQGKLTLTGGDSEATAIYISNNICTAGVGGGAYSSTSTSYAIVSTGYVNINGNSAGTNGGGLSVDSGGMDLSGNIKIYENYAKGSNYGGGGIYSSSNSTGTVYLHDGVEIFDNTCGLHGGGVYGRYEVKIADGAKIHDNYATSSGGGVAALKVTMEGGEIYNNSAANGGGIYDAQGNSADTNVASHISRGKIYNNTARTGSGGGIYASSYINILYIDDVEIYDNTAYSYGGGIYWTDLFVFNGGTITGNTAQRGGGVYIVGYVKQSATIKIADGKSGIIYDNTATAVNYGNDLALGYSSTSVNASGTYNGNSGSYALMTVGAASTFTDSANGITGVSWYDEVGDTTNEEAFNTESSSSSQEAGHYYTLIYKETGAAIAEIWNTALNSGNGEYETFTSVQAAVDAVAGDTASKYGTENGSNDTITIIMLDDSREDITIPAGVSVTLDLAGCTLTGLLKSVITVETGASLIIDDRSTEGTGTITGGDGTYFNYIGTTNAYCGGGLLVCGSAILKGGTICGNTTALGAGVFVTANGTFTLDGGTIASNTATNNGGGVYVVSGYTNSTYTTSDPNFTMISGSVTGNKAGSGAGVYLYSTYLNAEISGGSITGNTATSNGGGIFVNSTSIVTVTGGLITGNTAVTGGGLYSNNTNSSLTVSDAAGIYGNTATSNTGNDIYAKVKGGSISILAAVSMGNDAYNSWFDSNGDDSTYPNYYTESISGVSLASEHDFALTATYYSGGYVAYIPNDSSSNTVYQVATTDSETGSTIYSYTMDSTAAAEAQSAGSTVTSKAGTAYSTLQGAINAAGNNDTIYLLTDVYESVSVTGVADRASLTIDLNGYTLYSTGEYGVYIKYDKNVSMTLTIQSTATNAFVNTETDAAGTITKASSNLSDFPRGIYMASGSSTYETYLIVDSVVITGFGNEAYASESYSSTYAGGAIYADSYNSVTLQGNTMITDCCAYQGGGIYSKGYNNYLTIKDGVVISENTAYHGGGIFFSASGTGNNGYKEALTIGEAKISDNTAAYRGGGIYVTGWNSTDISSKGSWPMVTMEGTTITENTAAESAGAYLVYVMDVTIDSCTVEKNASTGNFGGMYISQSSNTLNYAEVVITDSEFTGNTAASGYAGLSVANGKVTVSECAFKENKASTNASALYISTVLSGSTISNCTFTDNETTTSGNVINIANSSVEVSYVTVTGNKTAASVGAVYVADTSSSVQGNVTFDECNFSSNSGYGMELLTQGDSAQGEIVTIKNTSIKGNSGYGIYMRQSNSFYNGRDSYVLNIEDGMEIANNGNTGIYANGYGTLNIKGGKIHDNTGASYGGGVYAQYTDFHMTGGEIYNNTAPRGGGVYLVESANTYTGGTISSVTYGEAATDTITGGKIYNNTSTITTDSGGGIYVGNYNKLVMTGGTVTGNTASGQGGGVYVASNYASFELGTGTDAASGADTVGQVYGNTAILGQDVYAEYSSSYANTSLALIKAEDMFGDDEGMAGIGWLNESTSVVTTTSIDYDPVKKMYPFTLEYETNTVVAVIWDTSLNEGSGGYQTFTSVQAAVDALLADKTNGTGYYYTNDIADPEIILVSDAKGDVEISGGQTLTLNLNGYTLTGNTTAITCYGTLTIKDVQYKSDAASGEETYCEHYEALKNVNQSLHLDESGVTTKTGAGADESDTAYTGTITGTTATLGGGIRVYSGGYVTMVSGQIANCTAGGTTKNNASYGGAGVYVENGTFVLSGTASINNCSTKSYGGAVYIAGTSGTFILEEDAVIEDNTSYFGAVYMRNGTFKMTGGTITGNKAEGNIDSNTYSGYGGGVYVYAGTAKLTGGSITGNTATGRGGGIYINSGTVTLSGSIKVTDNSVTGSILTDASIGAGGGIYMNSGTLNIKTGVEITGNSAIRGGGIYQYNGTIKMTGGQITGNSADYGGGLVQYPTQAGTFTMTGGVLCDNTSNLSSAGNDVYSISESGYTYSGTNYPTATLVRAADMDYTDEGYTASYNVWKDDTYTGTNRTAEYVGDGQYITEKITTSYNLMLTAEKYGDTEATTVETTELTVTSLTLTGKGITDGTKNFDKSDGLTYTPTSYTMDTGETETVSTWSATSLENAVAGDWTAGNDSDESNGLVRTFDSITYHCNATLGFEGAVEGDVKKTVRLYVQVTLPLSSDEAEMSIAAGGLDSYEVEESEDGKSLILLGYSDVPEAAKNDASFDLTIYVKAMKNGETVEPSFSAWIEGNAANKEKPVTMDPTAVTVSAAGKYNVTLLPNSELAYTGYFDMATGEETTKTAYETQGDNGTIIYGTILGYGITLSMWNDDTGKGMKGLEIPEGEITFSLAMTGTLSSTAEGSDLSIDAAPYVWAYKANENTESGSSLNDELRNVNMNWNDEDDSSSTTQYAYDGAPFNTRGSNTSSCYSGGAWSATGSQPDGTGTTTTIQFSVSGYTIDSTYSTKNPTQTSDGNSSEVFDNNYSRAFSAGYIQMLYPIDTDDVGEDDYGYLSIYMKGIVSELNLTPGPGGIVSADTSDPEDEDLQHFVSWYGESAYTGYATNEIVYLDNYVGNQTGLYITAGSGETIVKTNYFNNASNSKLSGSGGTASTPLGSTVYMGSDINFGSAAIDATTREGYDPQEDSAIEYNYLTAVNLLQKFDADAYTPTGTYKVTTTESATTWSGTKTTTYDLTVLYAAKPDGTNWTKSDDYLDGYDSPAPEMDQYGEENLIYFASLDDLYAYFEGKGTTGVCVGILYEFRDCCIRNGRSITVTSEMTVTNDFNKTGQTWCITNDVLGWSTYRPDYKDAYTYDLSHGTTTRIDLSYQYSWSDTVYDDTVSGVTAYGAGGVETLQAACKAAAEAYTEKSGYGCSSQCDFAKIAVYEPKYVKTEYSGGWSVEGTHSGWYSGNCLLLYTMESSIAIQVTDTVAGSNLPKSQYDIGQGERTANFLVTPTLASSSSIANELVSNGTQSAKVEITITLPEYLTYNEGSLQFNYGTEDTDYQEGELGWDITYVKNADGTTTITLCTNVTDISKTLPTVSYSTTIGTPGAAAGEAGEVPTGEKLTTTATINIEYEEIGQISTYAKEAETTITVLRSEGSLIWIEAKGTQELGTDLLFHLYYKNETDTARTIELGDILPYNGDKRGTSFTGGYRVTSIQLTFEDAESYNEFLAEVGNTANTCGIIKYGSGYDCTDTSKLGDVLDNLDANGTALTYSAYTTDTSNGVYSVTYMLSKEAQQALTQMASTGSGLGLYFYIPYVSGKTTVAIDVTLSPMVMENDGSSGTEMIIDTTSGSTQQGGNVYWDNLFYRVYSSGTVKNSTVLGSAGSRGIINRKITGIAWLDQDQDGIYNSLSSADQLLEGIEVYLYSSTEPDTGTYTNVKTGTDSTGDYWTDGKTTLYSTKLSLLNGTTVYPVINTNRLLVAPVSTGSNGSYTFENLFAGTYYVVFKDTDGSYYLAGTTDCPIEFSKLSVTTEPSQSGATNKAQADYNYDTDAESDSGGAAALAQAVVMDENTASGTGGIVLPTSPSENPYVVANLNAGFYFINLNMEKEWENIISNIEEGTAVTFTVTGTTTDNSGTVTTVVNDTYTLTQGSTSNTVSVSKNGTPVSSSPTVTVAEDTENRTVTWTLGTVVLQAKGSNGSSATTISYDVTEAAVEPVKDANGTVTGTQKLTGFVTSVETTGGDGASSSIMSVTATNTQVLYELALYKISTSNNTVSYLSNAEFTLYTDEACTTEAALVTNGASGTSGASVSSTTGISTTDTDVGKLYIGQFTEGTYYLKETVAPSGYELNQSIWKITIKYENDSTTTDDDSNWTYVPKISVTLVQEADGTAIPEAKQQTDTFSLTDASTSPAASTTGDTDTVYVASTRNGSVTGSADPYTLYTLSFQMANEIIYALPQTGSVGIVWPTLAGIALMLAALVINERKRWMADA
ncbi:MAG: right-handed parallel beta-helix repeat-containing protein [Lachnospiraceae bacterium]|nr:right-handed parallel beta-helix repeat-containing protein [Lachnospiraceae bacterium]